MSVVAFRDGIMAADSAVFRDDYAAGDTAKLQVVQDLGVIGLVGHVGYGLEFCRRCSVAPEKWREVTMPEPPSGGFQGVLALFSRKLFIFDCGYFVPINSAFFAMGIEEGFARGAMAAGATAVEAVVLTAGFVIGVGGQVVSEVVWKEEERPWPR